MSHRTPQSSSTWQHLSPDAAQRVKVSRGLIAIIGGVRGDGCSFLARNLAALISESTQPIAISTENSFAMSATQSASDARLLDCPPGYQSVASVARLECQQVVLCASPAPESIVNIYATVKALHQVGFQGHITLVMNRATPSVGLEHARRVNRATEQFLGRVLNYGGALPFDRRLEHAHADARPAVLRWPRAPLSVTLRRLGGELGLAQRVRRPARDAWSRVAALFL